MTADSLVFERGFLPPTIVKIDTEGHEPRVFSGMTRIISEFQPIIFFEHIGMTDHEIANLTPKGCRLGSVAQPSGIITNAFDRDVGHNSVMFPVK